MPKKVRVGRSAFCFVLFCFFVFFAKGDFVGKDSVCIFVGENSVFRVIYVNKTKSLKLGHFLGTVGLQTSFFFLGLSQFTQM